VLPQRLDLGNPSTKLTVVRRSRPTASNLQPACLLGPSERIWDRPLKRAKTYSVCVELSLLFLPFRIYGGRSRVRSFFLNGGLTATSLSLTGRCGLVRLRVPPLLDGGRVPFPQVLTIALPVPFSFFLVLYMLLSPRTQLPPLRMCIAIPFAYSLVRVFPLLPAMMSGDVYY